MDDRVARLESIVAILTERVADLELRLEGFERRAPDDQPAHTTVPPIDAFERAPVQQWLGLAGRVFLVLGGAYLLRALTESHVLPDDVGVALGLLYGAPWLVLAARAGARGAQLDALCHALATALIGYPLVWEATVRFEVLAPPQSAALLGALTAAALVLAAVTRLQSLAWVVTFGAVGSAIGLAAATRDWNSYTLLVVGLGVGTLWLAYVRNWGVCWLAAAGANFMLFVATGRAAVSGAVQGALALQVLAFAGYVGWFAARTIAGRHRLASFEIAQTAFILVIALGGSIVVLQPRATAAGVLALVLGLTTYFVAFGFLRLRREPNTFSFWASGALVLAVVGTAVCFGASGASIAFAASAAALAVAARRDGSLTLNFHAAVYALSAAAASGLVGAATLALVRPPSVGWRSFDAATVLAFVSVAAIVLTPVRAAGSSWTCGVRILRLVLVSTLLWTSMGIAVLLLTAALGDPRRLDVSVLATLRTGILVAAILVLARVERYDSGREAGWLMYPLLVITGLKLVFFDLPLGRPQTLFAALALYGVALIVAPRLSRGMIQPRAGDRPTETGQTEAVALDGSSRI